MEILWFVGYCVDFPKLLAYRVGGHPDWNRHVVYRAIKDGYLSVYRGTYRNRVINSLRLTDAGVDYLGERDPASLALILARKEHGQTSSHTSAERVMRAHAMAVALVMAYNAGAKILPQDKPSLALDSNRSVPIDPETTYFYSNAELRSAIYKSDPKAAVKGSRNVGIIIRGHRLFFLYFTGHSRMFWMPATEDNFAGAVEALLHARGFPAAVSAQVLIANRMAVAERIVRYSKSHSKCDRRYFRVSPEYNNCFFILNNADGDLLLSYIIDLKKQQRVNVNILSEYLPPRSASREYDAITQDGNQPVILGYQCDLLPLIMMDESIPGFQGSPIVLCTDYQMNTIQSILGPLIEVRSIPEEVFHEG